MTTTTAARPKISTASHWYDRTTGDPRHSITGKNGKERKTTLRDAKEHGYLPSVTSVLKDVLAAPNLTSWLIERAVMATQTTPRKENEPLDTFIARALAEAEAEQREAMDEGTRIHKLIEDWLVTNAAPHPDIANVVAWMEKQHETFTAFEATLIGDGYAGRCDLVSQDSAGMYWITDFKTTKTKPEKSDDYIGGYNEHILQLAAYAAAWERKQGQEFAPVNIGIRNLYISTTEPGRIVPRVYPEWRQSYQCFWHLQRAWVHLKQYDPSKPAQSVDQQLDKAGL